MRRHRNRRGATALAWPLFDEAFYLRRYPEVALARLDARKHYRDSGEVMGYRPNALFDPLWYTAQHKAELEPGHSAFAHFIDRGGIDRPMPLFDPLWYREAHALDPVQHPCPLSHYLTVGAASELSPHPLFDAAWYCENYPEVRANTFNPLAHYVELGEAAGYWPNACFDPAWVRETYFPSREDRVAGGALQYYVETRASLNTRPHPLFDPDWYQSRYPIVERLSVDPLTHYLSHGRAAGHAPNAFADPAHPDGLSDRLAKFRGLLDEAREATQSSGARDDVLFECLARTSPRSTTSENAVVRDESSAAFPSIESVAHRAPVVSIIVPNYNQPFFTFACVLSVLRAHTRTPFEIVVSDDASTSDQRLRDLLRDWPNVRCLQQQSNVGFVRNCNAAAREARGEFLVFLNNDTLVTDGWLDELVATFDRFPNVGIAGSKLLFPNGSIAEAGGIVWRDASAWNFGRHRASDDRAVSYAREVDYVSGASLMLRKALFDELNGFDEAFAPAYFEDTDLAFRVRQAGMRVVYQPNSEVIHFEGVSSGTRLESGVKRYQQVNQRTFSERWHSNVALHGERGHEPDTEKDRYTPRDALVIDACVPTPQRDARSRRLVNIMKILRNDGFKVTFVAETFDAGEPAVHELRGSGVDVFVLSAADTLETFLHREGAVYDVCFLARPSVSQRWLNAIEQACPRARILSDQSDLWRDGEAVEIPGKIESRIRRLANYGPTHGTASIANSATNVPHIHESVPSTRGPNSRIGIWVVTGLRADTTADSLLWLRDEVFPILTARAHGAYALEFRFKQSDWADYLVEDCRMLRPVRDAMLIGPTALDSFRIAIAPARFGPDLGSQIEHILSRGIPCVATSRAASGMTGRSTDSIIVADSPRDFADAILALYDDELRWSNASHACTLRTSTLYPYREAVESLRSLVS